MTLAAALIVYAQVERERIPPTVEDLETTSAMLRRHMVQHIDALSQTGFSKLTHARDYIEKQIAQAVNPDTQETAKP